MKRTSLVCFGALGSKDSLVYQEIPARDGGEEFFLFLSPAEEAQEPLLRNLFRQAVSTSRLGAPVHYFSQFIEQFKALSTGGERPEDILAGALIMIEIRRAADVYLLCTRDAALVHWDAERGLGGPAESVRGFEEIALNAAVGQRDLFQRLPEDLFVLYHFTMAHGTHTLILVPSSGFIEQHAESLRNSIFFPSFGLPTDTGIELAVARSFPALYWRGGEETPAAAAKGKMRGRAGRVIGPVAAVAAAAVLLVLSIPLMKHGARRDAKEPALLAAVDDTKRDSIQSPPREESRALAPARENGASLSEAWKKKLKGPVSAAPAVCGGMVYVGCRDGALYAFTRDGDLAWKHRTGAAIRAAPCCAGARVVSANYRGDLICVDAKTGKTVWSVPMRSRIVSAPAASNGLIVVGTTDGRLIAVRPKDGKRMWEKKLGRSISVDVAIGPTYIVGATSEGSIVKLDGGGKVAWKTACGSGISSAPACLDDKDIIVLGCTDRSIRAYSLSSGAPLWKYASASEMGGAASFGPGVLFAGTKNGACLALRLDGTPLWERAVGGGISSRPLLVGGTLFVATLDSRLLALDSGTGSLAGEFRASSPVYSSPGAGEDRVYFGSNGGVFYAVWIHARTAT